ncbi:hypothetical protein H9K75_17320 [Diaphorobacter aerolatus]|uniref:Uncharacterized protein n=2 Tax=Diaphorobacter aerolatus TaxID=1288495 RepID=A0A7H0GQM2_9BURK|nr:hypothetical protein H9K75_17320 [Diaphorobacter aerolatus]
MALDEELRAHGDDRVSVARLCKMLDASASALMREATLLGDAEIAGQRGPGLLRMEQENGRWMVRLTDAGLALLVRQRACGESTGD